MHLIFNIKDNEKNPKVFLGKGIFLDENDVEEEELILYVPYMIDLEDNSIKCTVWLEYGGNFNDWLKIDELFTEKKVEDVSEFFKKYTLKKIDESEVYEFFKQYRE